MRNNNILCLLVIVCASFGPFASAQAFLHAISADTVIKVPLYNVNNTYYGEMQIGTPPQSFKVLFDNSYLGFVVPSTSCTNDICQPHAKYNSNQSSTYIDTYGSMYMNPSNFGPDYAGIGTGANDTIIIGGVQVPDMPFMDVSNFTGEDYKNAPFDVICGLQFDDPTFPNHPLYTVLMQRGLLSDTKFAVSLTTEPGDSGSFFILGGYDSSRAPRGFDYYDVFLDSRSWMVQAEDYGLGNTSYANGTLYVGINTALESTYGGAGPMQNLISQFGTLDCSHIFNYPNFYVTINGMKYQMPPRNYIFTSEEGCELGLLADQDLDDSLLVLGTHFIRAHYTVFDFGSNQIGIAKPPPHEDILSF